VEKSSSRGSEMSRSRSTLTGSLGGVGRRKETMGSSTRTSSKVDPNLYLCIDSSQASRSM